MARKETMSIDIAGSAREGRLARIRRLAGRGCVLVETAAMERLPIAADPAMWTDEQLGEVLSTPLLMERLQQDPELLKKVMEQAGKRNLKPPKDIGPWLEHGWFILWTGHAPTGFFSNRHQAELARQRLVDAFAKGEKMANLPNNIPYYDDLIAEQAARMLVPATPDKTTRDARKRALTEATDDSEEMARQLIDHPFYEKKRRQFGEKIIEVTKAPEGMKPSGEAVVQGGRPTNENRDAAWRDVEKNRDTESQQAGRMLQFEKERDDFVVDSVRQVARRVKMREEGIDPDKMADDSMAKQAAWVPGPGVWEPGLNHEIHRWSPYLGSMSEFMKNFPGGIPQWKQWRRGLQHNPVGEVQDRVELDTYPSKPVKDYGPSASDIGRPLPPPSVKTAAKKHGGAMLALMAPKEVSRALRKAGIVDEDTVSSDGLHMTLLYLGKAKDIDKKTMEAICRAAEKVCARHEPLAMRISGAGMFMAGEDGTPVYVVPNAKGLSALQADLESTIGNLVDLPSEHGWVPHMTMGYCADKPEIPDLAGFPGWTADKVRIQAGGDKVKDIPLGMRKKADVRELGGPGLWSDEPPPNLNEELPGLDEETQFEQVLAKMRRGEDLKPEDVDLLGQDSLFELWQRIPYMPHAKLESAVLIGSKIEHWPAESVVRTMETGRRLREEENRRLLEKHKSQQPPSPVPAPSRKKRPHRPEPSAGTGWRTPEQKKLDMEWHEQALERRKNRKPQPSKRVPAWRKEIRRRIKEREKKGGSLGRILKAACVLDDAGDEAGLARLARQLDLYLSRAIERTAHYEPSKGDETPAFWRRNMDYAPYEGSPWRGSLSEFKKRFPGGLKDFLEWRRKTKKQRWRMHKIKSSLEPLAKQASGDAGVVLEAVDLLETLHHRAHYEPVGGDDVDKLGDEEPKLWSDSPKHKTIEEFLDKYRKHHGRDADDGQLALDAVRDMIRYWSLLLKKPKRKKR